MHFKKYFFKNVLHMCIHSGEELIKRRKQKFHSPSLSSGVAVTGKYKVFAAQRESAMVEAAFVHYHFK